MKLGPQMADISVDNQRANFNTRPMFMQFDKENQVNNFEKRFSAF